MRSVFIFILAITSHIAMAQAPVLRVYTSSSFASEWGPGPTLEKSFEKDCKCDLKFIPAADGQAILSRLKLEKNSPKADVVVGLDSTLTATADRTDLFLDLDISAEPMQIKQIHASSRSFLPYDFGYYAFMFDTKAKNGRGLAYSKPSSLEDLISNPEYQKSVIIQDPRSSAAGLALLLWLRSVYGEKTTEKFPQLKRQLLSITKGWSEAYKLFTSGEAPIVLSYTTSEAYHREQDKTDRYQALIFPEGHYLAVEHAAILRSSKQIELAKMFLRHLLMPNSQTTIASKNWMYPVISSTILPKAYTMLQLPNQVLQLKPAEIDKNREKWIKEWQTQIRKN